MFTSTFSFFPYLLGWLGFLVALIRGASAAIAFTKPARATCWIAFTAGVLLVAGDLIYLTDLANSVDASWSGLRPVPEALIEPDGSLRSSYYIYPSIRALNATIAMWWWRLGLLGAGLSACLGSLCWARSATPAGVPPRPIAVGERALLFMGVVGAACFALRFIA